VKEKNSVKRKEVVVLRLGLDAGLSDQANQAHQLDSRGVCHEKKPPTELRAVTPLASIGHAVLLAWAPRRMSSMHPSTGLGKVKARKQGKPADEPRVAHIACFASRLSCLLDVRAHSIWGWRGCSLPGCPSIRPLCVSDCSGGECLPGCSVWPLFLRSG